MFLVLPFGVRSQIEANDVTAGSEPGAPTRPNLLIKLAVNTVLAAIVVGLLFWALTSPLITEYWR